MGSMGKLTDPVAAARIAHVFRQAYERQQRDAAEEEQAGRFLDSLARELAGGR